MRQIRSHGRADKPERQKKKTKPPEEEERGEEKKEEVRVKNKGE